MAKLDVQGFNAFEADLEAAKNLTEDEQRAILTAGAEVVKEWIQRKLDSVIKHVNDRGVIQHVRDSLVIGFETDEDRPIAVIRAHGKHHMYNRRLVTKTYKRSKHGRTYTVGGDTKPVYQSEVLFLLEYGSKHNQAHHSVELAAEESAAETTAAMQEAFNAILNSKMAGGET